MPWIRGSGGVLARHRARLGIAAAHVLGRLRRGELLAAASLRNLVDGVLGVEQAAICDDDDDDELVANPPTPCQIGKHP